ncbi:YqiA/YcfP family alpha/beta fold hydrolase [Piscinibacter sakaiensis]|uniref:YqiA/YcfP family alpha/beta fold hydrolase n=1 Tax=Piscinibacter sakaiensis TaxID=1547922 RepID=UPI003AACF794
MDQTTQPMTPPTPVSHLLYLHGFRSSPRSTKATQMARWVARHRPEVSWACPQLPPSPAAAMAMIRELTAHWPAASRAVIGSSLGGFYAGLLGEELGCRTVLINPAVDQARDLAAMIGSTTTWHGNEPFEFRAEHVDELRRLTPPRLLRQQLMLALIAKGDEVLDWREMVDRHHGAKMVLLEGGDHAFSEFENHLGTIAGFFGWS